MTPERQREIEEEEALRHQIRRRRWAGRLQGCGCLMIVVPFGLMIFLAKEHGRMDDQDLQGSFGLLIILGIVAYIAGLFYDRKKP